MTTRRVAWRRSDEVQADEHCTLTLRDSGLSLVGTILGGEDGLPVRVVYHALVFPGYDNVVARAPALGRAVRAVTYALERTPLRIFALSHLLVIDRLIG